MKIKPKRDLKAACDLFHKGSITLARMEHNGMRVDMGYLNNAIETTAKQIEDLGKELQSDAVYTKHWKRRFGSKSNLSSRPQLGTVLFECLGYECKSHTPTGRYKVDEAALATVEEPFVKTYLKREGLIKDKNTFLEGIRREVVDGFLHPFFKLHTTQTYRSSSTDPNLQNMPIRDPLKGKLIRRCFIPRKGRELVEIDYSGIEVRIAACYNHDPKLIEYIKNPKLDMHRDMAAECFMLKSEQVSKICRYAGKNMFVFPAFYGSYYPDIARNLWEGIEQLKLGDAKDSLTANGITKLGKCDPDKKPRPNTFEWHIQRVEADFWGKRFKVYKQWKDDWYNLYRKRGYVDYFTGFRVEGLLRRNEAINYPIQGAAFHCLLEACNLIQRRIDKFFMKALPICEIHDSIIGDVPKKEVRNYVDMAREVMTVKIPKKWPWIIVPLEVEIETSSTNWFEKKRYEE